MKRPERKSDGKYYIGNKCYPELFGSRRQVWNGTAYKTTGLLKKENLTMNGQRRIVSAKKYKSAKQEKRLEKHGYFANPKGGKFGYVLKNNLGKTKRATKRKQRGGGGETVVNAEPTTAATKKGFFW